MVCESDLFSSRNGIINRMIKIGIGIRIGNIKTTINDEFGDYVIYVDDKGNILTDEYGNILIE